MDKRNDNSEKNNNLTTLIKPEDFTKTLESAMHVFQYGHTDRIPDLMQDTGNLLVKVSKRLSTTQLVLAVAVVAVGIIFAVKQVEDAMEDDE